MCWRASRARGISGSSPRRPRGSSRGRATAFGRPRKGFRCSDLCEACNALLGICRGGRCPIFGWRRINGPRCVFSDGGDAAVVSQQLVQRNQRQADGVCEDADVYRQQRLTTPESDMSTIHHDITTPAPPQLQEVDDGVFAYIQPDGTWWINNTGFLVGQRRVISIDTCATV